MKKFELVANKILAIICICLLLILQVVFIMPTYSNAATAGDVLVVRVQYFGESGNKIREKARFTRSELEAMGTETHYYSNVTSVGTVMSLAGRGPRVLTIIEKAGIDLNSVQSFTFRTVDGYTRNFNLPTHLTATKYYYPNLSSKYERGDNGDSMTLLDGATANKVSVPAILALECAESKAPNTDAKNLSMNTKKAYRFCMGQSELYDGKEVDLYKDVTSVDSCHSIYGLDVTLYGSPDDEGTDVDSKDDIGSKKKSTAEKKQSNSSKSAKKVYIKARELVLGDKIVEDVSPEEKFRNNMAAEAKALNDVEPYSKGAAIAVGTGTAALFGLGAIARIIKFKRKF